MPSSSSSRHILFVSIAGVAFATTLVAQQLPPAAGTGQPASQTSSPASVSPPAQGATATPPPAAGGSAAPRPVHHSRIIYTDGWLTVSASNASLNGLIREIAHDSGMQVSGSVAEDRVFGTYGPGDPQKVLTELLEGTGTNILILSNAADAPLQLILTARTGTATPPNPNANVAPDDDDDDATPPPGLPPNSAPRSGRAAFQPGSVPPASSQPNANGSPAAPQPTSGDGAPPSDNSVKTPQQIFEQLQRLRQNGSATTPNPQ